MCKFESLQKVESRVQSADSFKAYRKPRAFNCCRQLMLHFFLITEWVLFVESFNNPCISSLPNAKWDASTFDVSLYLP